MAKRVILLPLIETRPAPTPADPEPAATYEPDWLGVYAADDPPPYVWKVNYRDIGKVEVDASETKLNALTTASKAHFAAP